MSICWIAYKWQLETSQESRGAAWGLPFNFIKGHYEVEAVASLVSWESSI
jgi:hypothetical protein